VVLGTEKLKNYFKELMLPVPYIGTHENKLLCIDFFYFYMNKYTFTFCVLTSLHLLATILNLTLLLTWCKKLKKKIKIMKFCFYYASLSVRPFVCLSICLSVTLSCPLYIFLTPGGIYK